MALLRIAVGWHFAYEGLAKLFDPAVVCRGVSAIGELGGAGLFHRLAENPTLLAITNQVNMWALVVIGVALMLGCATRSGGGGGDGSVGAVLSGSSSVVHADGGGCRRQLSDRQQERGRDAGPAGRGDIFARSVGLGSVSAADVEFGLVRLAGYPGASTGSRSTANRSRRAIPETLARRQALAGLVSVPFFGAFVMAVLKKRGTRARRRSNWRRRRRRAVGRFDEGRLEHAGPTEGPGTAAKIKQVELSRVMMGGNLMNGFAHARDLIYVSKLIRAYHDRDKVFETFRLAEACGINAIITNPILAPMIVDYWENGGGKIQFVAQCKGKDEQEFLDNIAFLDRPRRLCGLRAGRRRRTRTSARGTSI
jgi:hypothetical protein